MAKSKSAIVAGIIVLAASVCYAVVSRTERVATEAAPKVVKIGIRFGMRGGSGSGAIISRTGLILTCNHVINSGQFDKLFVKYDDGSVYKGGVLAYSQKLDLAIIITTRTLATPYFDLGGEVRRGQPVMSLGAPLGIQRTVSVGWVENLVENIIVHSASVNPGNSGGPLIDMQGKLVGINQAMVMLNEFTPAQGMSVAIPVREVRAFISGVMRLLN